MNVSAGQTDLLFILAVVLIVTWIRSWKLARQPVSQGRQRLTQPSQVTPVDHWPTGGPENNGDTTEERSRIDCDSVHGYLELPDTRHA